MSLSSALKFYPSYSRICQPTNCVHALSNYRVHRQTRAYRRQVFHYPSVFGDFNKIRSYLTEHVCLTVLYGISARKKSRLHNMAATSGAVAIAYRRWLDYFNSAFPENPLQQVYKVQQRVYVLSTRRNLIRYFRSLLSVSRVSAKSCGRFSGKFTSQNFGRILYKQELINC